jgi:glycine cleavage system H protein
MNIPNDRRYAKSHEWAKKEGDLVVIGISDFAQHELGDVVFVEVPPAGSTFKKGEVFGVIESVKAASDLYLPVGGEIVAGNDALTAEPALVNGDPYGAAWLVKIKPAAPAELDGLMDAAAYGKFVASEPGH